MKFAAIELEEVIEGRHSTINLIDVTIFDDRHNGRKIVFKTPKDKYYEVLWHNIIEDEYDVRRWDSDWYGFVECDEVFPKISYVRKM